MRNPQERYDEAREQFEALGVNVPAALEKLKNTSLSIHCWQGDDVEGFDRNGTLDGGIQVTGSRAGKAENFSELTADLDQALALIPGTNRINLHASYPAPVRGKERNRLEPVDFVDWTDWAVDRGMGVDFNPTFFAHPLSGEEGTLSSTDPQVREFWIEHGICSRRIAASFAERTGKACVNNLWIPDGRKETPIDTMAPRIRLREALDRIYEERIGTDLVKDAVESKLFGIGSEAYVVGSHEFYLEYTAARPGQDVMLTLDLGHFHPTETVSGKLSALLLFCPELLIHFSRPVRWDSDHVVTWNDEMNDVLCELIRLDALDRVTLALDYFDGSVNRILAWAIGARNTKKALLRALLQPLDLLRSYEQEGDLGRRLALLEEWKTLPVQAIWDYFCLSSGVPSGLEWIDTACRYEAGIRQRRSERCTWNTKD